MFDREIKINQLLLGQFAAIAADLSEQSLFQPSAGHGHPPIWILGHLAICGELGQRYLGGELRHPGWLELFGPGSSDKIVDDGILNKHDLLSCIEDTYRRFRELALDAKEDGLQASHGIPFFKGTPIESVADCVSLLLTSHFGFHLSQLSSCRRSAGYPRLF